MSDSNNLVKTRFAPSPTGHLHIGGARTALFNYLFARRHGGTFVLRIEDTDRERSKPEFTTAIIQGLEWLGITADEGPYYQSERGELYASRVKRLLAEGNAYHCFCTAEEIAEKRKAAEAEGKRWTYDRTCRDTGRVPVDGESPVVRFKTPIEGSTVVEDMIRGSVTFDHAELDDLIIVRSDGTPTFHLVVVVDDLEMGISHILRGEDHLTNTPRQVLIFAALGATPPRYGHMPLIVGKDRARLSKRHGATSVDAYREQGFLPSAMQNYLARLGWSHGDQEVFSTDELIQLFDIEAVGKAAAAFDLEKLAWVSAQHIKTADRAALASAVLPFLQERGVACDDHAYLGQVVELFRERAKTLVELAEGCLYFFGESVEFDEKARGKFLGEDGRSKLGALLEALDGISDWNEAELERVFTEVRERLDVGLGKLAQPLRVALTGGTVSPGIYELCAVLGRERTLARIGAAIAAA